MNVRIHEPLDLQSHRHVAEKLLEPLINIGE